MSFVTAITDCAFKVFLYPQFHMFDQGLGPPFRCIRVLYPGLPVTFCNRILRLASSGGSVIDVRSLGLGKTVGS
jgi:hypothetical protein